MMPPLSEYSIIYFTLPYLFHVYLLYTCTGVGWVLKTERAMWYDKRLIVTTFLILRYEGNDGHQKFVLCYDLMTAFLSLFLFPHSLYCLSTYLRTYFIYLLVLIRCHIAYKWELYEGR
ncbi:hypothetical protein BDW75DRAFT_123861 [Aspergillus navahoensis]